MNGTTTTNLSLTYDSLGNILTKNEAGTQDAAVDQSITWTSFNFPASITAATTGETASFWYGPDRQRWKMVFTGPTVNETTAYIGGLMEKVDGGGPKDYRHYISVGGEVIAIYSRSEAGVNTIRYVLGNHQGSVDTIASSAGGVVADESFTAYGLRRNAATWSGAPSASDRSTADSVTRQGYTFQTVLGMMGLNHMNGRVQDAINGRFLSPDPFVTEPGYTQNFNRYAYVANNPLSATDPSGFEACHVQVIDGIETCTGYPREPDPWSHPWTYPYDPYNPYDSPASPGGGDAAPSSPQPDPSDAVETVNVTSTKINKRGALRTWMCIPPMAAGYST